MIGLIPGLFGWKYRNSDTGRFITKEAYLTLPESKRAKSRKWWPA